MRRILGTALLAAATITFAAPAYAAGAELAPGGVRVEAGEQIELTADVSPGALGWVEDGPFFAFLLGEGYGKVLTSAPGGATTDVPLGEVSIQPAGNHAAVSVLVTVPPETPPGRYQIVICNDPCTTGLGNLTGGTLFVGVDPPPPAGTVTQVSAVASTVAVDVVSTSVAKEPAGHTTAYLALPAPPERATQISPLWIAFSAAIGGTVLLLALLIRDRS